MHETWLTAEELIRSGECWPSCLLALNRVDVCECPCNGAYHGELTGSIVRSYETGRMLIERWWERCGYSQWTLANGLPPRAGIEKRRSKWFGAWEWNMFDGPDQLRGDAYEAIEALSKHLLRTRRCRFVYVTRDGVGISQSLTQWDARAFLFITYEVATSNMDGARRVNELFASIANERKGSNDVLSTTPAGSARRL